MNFIKNPNLPEKGVKTVVVDGRISNGIELGLEKLGIKLIKMCSYPGVYDAVACHPDLFLHHVGGDRIVYAPGTCPYTINILKELGFLLLPGLTVLSHKYPSNIAYNAARVGNFVIHNLKYTDGILKKELENSRVEFIHVNQGYTKCSVSVVGSNSIITADRGIAKAAEAKGIEVLVIEPDKNILLPGLDMGFIGGSTGLLGSRKWAVAGSLECLKSSGLIKSFLEKRGFEIISLSNQQVMDIGTIIPIIEE